MINKDNRTALRSLYRAPEEEVLPPLITMATLSTEIFNKVRSRASSLVKSTRAVRTYGPDITNFLKEYKLGTKEGIALLCLAEALLRIPDVTTSEEFIKDHIVGIDWQRHLGKSDNMIVNASSRSLVLANRILSINNDQLGWINTIKSVVQRLGEPVIRLALRQGMGILARQFIMGKTIGEAVSRTHTNSAKKWRYSFDMLGESAKTRADADRYMSSYQEAINIVGLEDGDPITGPGISIKLSALHPRYTSLQSYQCVPSLIASLTNLAVLAKKANIGLTIDAEESDKLEISLDIFSAVLSDPILEGWDGFGLAIQAYQKRAMAVIDWTIALGEQTSHRIPVRLVKGAYWDTEIKHAQIQGYHDYPVFTNKAATDISWIACARKMLLRQDQIQPAFATHNAYSLAVILEDSQNNNFEMQRLHGMGESLYKDIVGDSCPVRVYAPVGSHEDLLAYLVRRLLENGANSSFVQQLVNSNIAEDRIIEDPIISLKNNNNLVLPTNIYSTRKNSLGFDLSDPNNSDKIEEIYATAIPITLSGFGPERHIWDPSNRYRLIGSVPDTTLLEMDTALSKLSQGWQKWNSIGGPNRANILNKAADLIESTRSELLFLLAREAGKTLNDGIAEIRESVDFCRWYASQAREHFSGPKELPGPTGERNTWELRGRGIFACISPWNFPLAIFVGQITAALAAGNAVAAKPAEQTPLIAAKVVDLFYKAGIPTDVLSLLPGDGTIGKSLINDPRIAGVAFTGGNETARFISIDLSLRNGPIIPFIAETGGINAMIVDSSALPEQVVDDVLVSAFGSAGQRCSSLRLLCLQDDIADRIIVMLSGAAKLLIIGDPLNLSTDIGPIIDIHALTVLTDYATSMGRPLFELNLSDDTEQGTFFAPRAFMLSSVNDLQKEVFGPILHIVRYKAEDIDSLLTDIEKTGYGLTLGIHSRIETFQNYIINRSRIGNIYVNRNQIGAVVGVQPFGGSGLSGTGPKAGGPITLFRYAEEKVVSTNTAAIGGNAALLTSNQN